MEIILLDTVGIQQGIFQAKLYDNNPKFSQDVINKALLNLTKQGKFKQSKNNYFLRIKE